MLENTRTTHSPKRREKKGVLLLKTTIWSVVFHWTLKLIWTLLSHVFWFIHLCMSFREESLFPGECMHMFLCKGRRRSWIWPRRLWKQNCYLTDFAGDGTEASLQQDVRIGRQKLLPGLCCICTWLRRGKSNTRNGRWLFFWHCPHRVSKELTFF